jgi:single-strand DNA-binding protein
MINKVTLIGNLGGDPEIRHLDNGVLVGRFSLATNENYKDKEGNWQKLTEWHNIVVWRDLADRAEKQLKKGMTVYVEGKISYRKYTGQDGVERTSADIVAATMRLLEKPANTNESRFPASDSPYANTGGGAHNAAPASAHVSSMPDTPPPPETGDDLPF